ncbi:hypothetical protein ACFCZY_19195 [Streptomyces sp. NPDC056237]|uniref:hypothetical protein n=1 Tax=unclassified Streptomyces TaxID=2593676 RepID=UPI0035DC4574
MATPVKADSQQFVTAADKFCPACVGRDKRRIRYFIAVTPTEATERLNALTGAAPASGGVAPLSVVVLDGAGGRYRMPAPGDSEELQDAWFALATLDKKTADGAAKDDRCPTCGIDKGIGFLGTALAALASATVTQVFTGEEIVLLPEERKTLLFDDSTQDAAHRAGYVAKIAQVVHAVAARAESGAPHRGCSHPHRAARKRQKPQMNWGLSW